MLVVSAADVLGNFCRQMVFPYASLYILALGGDTRQVGLVSALTPLAGLVILPLGGYIADRAGRVKLVVLSNYFRGAVLLMYVLAPRWEVVAAGMLLLGISAIEFPAFSAIVADSLSPEDRGKGYATMRTVAGALAIFAPYVGGRVVDVFGANTGMRILYGVMMIAAFGSATIYRFLRETPSRSRERVRFSDLPRVLRKTYADIPTTLRRLPRSLKALAGVIVLTIVTNGVAGPYWVVYAIEHIGLSSSQWGLILLIELALQNLLFIPAGAVADRYGRARSLLVALLIALIAIPPFVFATSFAAVLILRAIVVVAFVMAMPACTALLADTVPVNMRGRVMAAIGQGGIMIGSVGGGTGGPAVGFVITLPLMMALFGGGFLYALNPRYPWYFAGALTALSVILNVLFIRDPQQAEV